MPVPDIEEPIAIPASAGIDDAAVLLSAGFELHAPRRKITARGRAIAKTPVMDVVRLKVTFICQGILKVLVARWVPLAEESIEL